jgi:FAD/FMN-containing dehydrogenase
MSLKADLAGIVGDGNAIDSEDILEPYSRDFSLVQPRKPACVAFAKSIEEIQEIVKYANENTIPLTPRSSKVGFYGAGIPVEGGVVVDLSRMNQILEIDPDNKRVKIEPGVTYLQLQETLEKDGLHVCNPLLPHPHKSVLTSSMEREPILITKPEYTETFCNSAIIFASGELFRTGSALGTGITSGIYPDGLFPGSNIYKGSQGTLGIMGWANVKVEWTPPEEKVVFVAFDKIDAIPEPLYAILRRHIGRECLVLNRHNIAAIAADEFKKGIDDLRLSLPPYTLILDLPGGQVFPGEKIEYQEEALQDIAEEKGFNILYEIPGVSGLENRVLEYLRKPWTKKEVYWKHLHKGGCSDIFFYTTMDRIPEFTRAIEQVAEKHQYPVDDIGSYFQPLEHGRISYCAYGFSYDPENNSEEEKIRSLFMEASEKAMDMGGFFTNPYGPWAEMVYSRTPAYAEALKLIKTAFDPNAIMNPGRLCF